eukprot:TRINITY_DN4004_c0_g1_i1.p1 TRINITY_DN4004_c0_g1~~TRINITY_DN4004_c0_g1_i1.p1  ORF type:complete len:451 (-),score=82.17 TRINITY_DN4004_c0_g1_i1:707-2059(-)
MATLPAPSTSLLDLPEELICHVLSFITGRQLLRMGSVSRQLYRIVDERDYFRWRCETELDVRTLKGHPSWRSLYSSYWSDFDVVPEMRAAFYIRQKDDQQRRWVLRIDGRLEIEQLKLLDGRVVVPLKFSNATLGRLLINVPCSRDIELKSGNSLQWEDDMQRFAVTFKTTTEAQDALRALKRWHGAGKFWLSSIGPVDTSTALHHPHTFLSVLARHFDLPRLTGLLAELAFVLELSTAPGVFSFADFVVFVDWFGPLHTLHISLPRFFHNIACALECLWFHGFMNRASAESMLNTKEDGTFLLRCSTSRRMCFAISCVSKQTSRHSLVYQDGPRCFRMGDVVGPTLQSVVAQVSCLLSKPLARDVNKWLGMSVRYVMSNAVAIGSILPTWDDDNPYDDSAVHAPLAPLALLDASLEVKKRLVFFWSTLKKRPSRSLFLVVCSNSSRVCL